jgi:hypothetical protein
LRVSLTSVAKSFPVTDAPAPIAAAANVSPGWEKNAILVQDSSAQKGTKSSS